MAATLAFASVSAMADNFGGVSYQSQAKMKSIIYAEFGHNWRGDAMVRCARRESGFNPRAANWRDSHGGSFGLLQINGVHNRGYGYATPKFIQAMFDPYQNVRMAHKLMNGAGLGPWGGGC